MRGWLYPMDGAHPLVETRKRAAERAQRAETPGKKSGASNSSTISIICIARSGNRPARLGVAQTGGNRRKPPAKTLLEKFSAVVLSHPRGAPQESICVTLAEIAEIVT
jgi:hypothetical protein